MFSIYKQNTETCREESPWVYIRENPTILNRVRFSMQKKPSSFDGYRPMYAYSFATFPFYHFTTMIMLYRTKTLLYFRHGGHSWLCGRRHGELGFDLVPWDGAAVRPSGLLHRQQAEGGRGRVSRTGAPGEKKGLFFSVKNQQIDQYGSVFQAVTFYLLINVNTSIYISSLVYMTQKNLSKVCLNLYFSQKYKSCFQECYIISQFWMGFAASQLRKKCLFKHFNNFSMFQIYLLLY